MFKQMYSGGDYFMAEPPTDTLYSPLWTVSQGEGMFTVLDESLHPRSADVLFEIAAQAGLKAGDRVLDVGCGRGNNSCDLARRFDCQVIGLDPVPSNIAQAEQLAAERGLADRVTFRLGTIEEITFPAHHFDLIWSREMLVHVRLLGEALHECYRVLKETGTFLIYTTVATELIEPQEAARLCQPLEIIMDNLAQPYLEQTFKTGGWQLTQVETLGSEPVEYLEEQSGRYSQQLRRIARMRRQRDRFVAELGEARYEQTLALYYWGIYQFLGKLSQVIYTLKKEIELTPGAG
jgi:ubiquinone/menaquinone biosynthesis C-methylase UbiE